MKEKNRGITLVALVVTIVILLILAGITLIYVFGDNGIIQLAKQAKNETEAGIGKEQNDLGTLANMLKEEYGNNAGNGNGDNTTNPPEQPDVPTPPEEVPIEDIKSDWATIEKIAQEIAKDDSITSDSEEAKVTVDGKTYTIKPGDLFEVKYNEEARRVRMLGFKHDDLVNTGVYGGSHTKASISFEFLDFMTGDTYMQMNASNTNSGGWGSAKLRTDLNGSGSSIGGLGANLNNKAYIKQVKKKYIPTYNTASTNTTNDYLWLLSCSEVWSKGRSDNSGAAYGLAITKEGEQYKWYKDNEKGIDPSAANSNFVKKPSASGSAYHWWLRSPDYRNSTSFCLVNSTGISHTYSASIRRGVAPGFCI